ncbi:MAG: bifunctional 4-hydroxy-2-oxoglutarate aldolase/2-dehydro-3-deoxy-phosphogluconate aldolase [Lachnospiraceae bacterium]|nr:bifunctional 4-hydroxy-2-oxoglutarate aldolase/2-dehydro-3-deoxy-phosphogluconate aldolase [Lachnospiraceae bacterium]
MEAAIKRFSEVGIIPVVVLNDAKDAEPLGQALMEGGLPAAEVTFRTDAAEESIRIMAEKFPDMLVGAGTVLTIDQAERAVAAGAKFIVSPGFDPEIVQFCLDRDIPVCPGVQTPSEVIQAYKFGLDHVKFFPAENAGGLAMIKAVGAAFPNMKFMPTGGISASNVTEYLENSKIFCCGGSWMVKGDMIKAGEFDKIKEKVAEAAAIVKKVRG